MISEPGMKDKTSVYMPLLSCIFIFLVKLIESPNFQKNWKLTTSTPKKNENEKKVKIITSPKFAAFLDAFIKLAIYEKHRLIVGKTQLVFDRLLRKAREADKTIVLKTLTFGFFFVFF